MKGNQATKPTEKDAPLPQRPPELIDNDPGPFPSEPMNDPQERDWLAQDRYAGYRRRRPYD